MKNLNWLVLLLFVVLVHCSMPVSVTEDESPTIGEKNAELLRNKIEEIGDNFNSIHVYYGQDIQNVISEYAIDGHFLIDLRDDAFYNLNELKELRVEEVTYSLQTEVIRIVF